MPVRAKDAIAARKDNPRAEWHVGKRSEVTTNPEHAAARIYAGFADITPIYNGPRLRFDDPVFAMGSCFAREIERWLIYLGGNVTSTDWALIDRPEFKDGEGLARDSFFHRFTPRAMWHEFMIAFDQLEGWDPNASLLFTRWLKTTDLNYWSVEGSNLGHDATVVRRRIAGELVRRAAAAKVIILTLGLTEGWIHKPTGFHINRFEPRVARNPDEFEFAIQSYDEVLQSLEDIRALLMRVHKTGDFQMAVTVSPVPLQTTFSGKDIILANMDSKSTLRAAAATFTGRHANVHYFPSYEMVMYTNPKLAWRPDRVHVNKAMVRGIVNRFIACYYEPGANGADRLKPPAAVPEPESA